MRIDRTLKSMSFFLSLGILFSFQNCGQMHPGSGNSNESQSNGLKVGTSLNKIAFLDQVQFDISGGSPPYTIQMVSGNGEIEGDSFNAPSLIETDVVSVSDSAGNTVKLELDIFAPDNSIADVKIVQGSTCPQGYQMSSTILDYSICQRFYDQATDATVISGLQIVNGSSCKSPAQSAGSATLCDSKGANCTTETLCIYRNNFPQVKVIAGFLGLNTGITQLESWISNFYVQATACNTGDLNVGKIGNTGYVACVRP